jgi:hypothetical protein
MTDDQLPDWTPEDRNLLGATHPALYDERTEQAARAIEQQERDHATLMMRAEWWTAEAIRILHGSKPDRDARSARALSHAMILAVRAAELRDPSDPIQAARAAKRAMDARTPASPRAVRPLLHRR